MASPSIHRIVVRIQTGSDRLAATDDPLFLGLGGSQGREFRLTLAKGKALRRGEQDCFVLGSPDDSDTNVSHPELNDPAAPSIDADSVTNVYLVKRTDPIPNVRGHGELDDRYELQSVEVELHCGEDAPRRFARQGPVWLGLACGFRLELTPANQA